MKKKNIKPVNRLLSKRITAFLTVLNRPASLFQINFILMFATPELLKGN